MLLSRRSPCRAVCRYIPLSANGGNEAVEKGKMVSPEVQFLAPSTSVRCVTAVVSVGVLDRGMH